MNKFIPIIALLGAGLLTTGCASDATQTTVNIDDNIKDFVTSVNAYTSLNETSGKTILDKYQIMIADEETDTSNKSNSEKERDEANRPQTLEIVDETRNIVEHDTNNDVETTTAATHLTKDIKDEDEKIEEQHNKESDKPNVNLKKGENLKISTLQVAANKTKNIATINAATENDTDTTDTANNNSEDSDNEQTETEELNDYEVDGISTLYYLTNDLEEYSEQYINLKTSLTEAITETESLLEKIKNNEISLTEEQSMMIATQSNQLKDLSKKLTRSTRELNLHLRDLNDIIQDGDMDSLSLKYLLVLDNLANGNEMLENGLHSLQLINQLCNLNNRMPKLNGQMMFGFQRNNQAPEFRNFDIKEGQLIEKENDNATENETNQTNTLNNEQTNRLDRNIDTYRNTMHNIDTFFNTALLDNQFMYGNNGFNGYNSFYGTYNPYVYNNMNTNQPATQNQNNELNAKNNTINGVDSMQNTLNNEKLNNKPKRGFVKNIDTYRTENTPSLSARFKNLKSNILSKKFKVDSHINQHHAKINPTKLNNEIKFFADKK